VKTLDSANGAKHNQTYHEYAPKALVIFIALCVFCKYLIAINYLSLKFTADRYAGIYGKRVTALAKLKDYLASQSMKRKTIMQMLIYISKFSEQILTQKLARGIRNTISRKRSLT